METLMQAQLGSGQTERESSPVKVLLEQKPCSTSGLHQKEKNPPKRQPSRCSRTSRRRRAPPGARSG